MKALKLVTALSLSALFCLACTSAGPETSNKPANANANTAPATSSQPAVTAAANANEGPKEAVKPATPEAPAPAKTEPAKTEPAKNEAAKPAAVDAAALFNANKCAGCHGPDGKGNPKIKGVPDFTDAAWQKKESDAELTKTIKEGKKPIMPAFGTKLSDAEVKALVAYVRKFAK